MAKKKNNELANTIDRIRKNSRQLVRELDIVKGIYLGTGYTFSQCHILYELSRHQSLNLLELAEILLIDKSNTSRTVKKLVELGLVKTKKVNIDNRQKLFSLTVKGQKALSKTSDLAKKQVSNAIEHLNDQEQETVIQGLELYARALRRSRLQSGYNFRPILKSDNPNVADVIRTVMMEFDAVGDGFSIGDAEVDNMYGNYRDKKSCYYVLVRDDVVVGGCGIAQLVGGKKDTCELRKMFFLPSTRGIGLGQRLLTILLDEAKTRGYKQCYLETLDRMTSANELYKQAGFEPLTQPMGKTGHCSCDRWYLLRW